VLALSLLACSGGRERAEPAPSDAATPVVRDASVPHLTDTGGRFPECDAYIAAVDEYIHCSKVPAEARRGTLQGIEAMKQGWGDPATMSPEAIKQINDGCKQAHYARGAGQREWTGCPP
jgi:hypothetical protein